MILRLEHVSFRYEGKYLAQKDVCIALHEGERVAVLGSNDAGKSTFFLCCNGVLRPQSGKVYLRGREITDSKRDIMLLRQAVGLVFQEPDSQIIAGTVESEISFGPMNLRLPHDEVIRRVSHALDCMSLDGYQTRAPQYLSGGEVIADDDINKVFASQDVLLQAGLKKLLLYAAAELLEKRFCKSGIFSKPKNIDEFGEYICGF